MQGALELTTQTLNELGQQSFSYTFTTPGVYQARIRGQSGNGYTFGGCDSSYTLSIQSPAPLHSSTHLGLTGSLPPAIYPSQAVTLHFDLAPGLPNGPLPGGTLTISENPAGGSSICQASVSGASVNYTLTFSIPGSHTLTASYSGDDRYDPSSLPGIALTVSPFNTLTNVSIAPQSPKPGQPVVLNASITAQPPGGMVTGGTVIFYDGDTILGAPVSLTDGAAHLDLAGLPVGPHKLSAIYSGDASYSASQSPVLELTIEPVVYFSYIPVVVR